MLLKHPLEERQSWELAVERAGGGIVAAPENDDGSHHRRQLKKKDPKHSKHEQQHSGHHHDRHKHEHEHKPHHNKHQEEKAAGADHVSSKNNNNDDDEEEKDEEITIDEPAPNATNTTTNQTKQQLPGGIQFKHQEYDKQVLPPPAKDTMQALMIDAGSQGTRIHVYEFQRRILYTPQELTQALNGFKLSIPTTNTRWTNRLKPGLDALAAIPDDDLLRDALVNYLGPLFEFARTVLDGKQKEWHRYPIYLKATGGLRTLPTPDRIRLINAVRELFQNTTFNPFNFDDPERARVISGEEEAMYGWAAVNFAIGTLVQDTEGKGVVLNPHRTWGMLEMGGASTQIAWFQNEGDVMANLMKLQIGGARHWNIYAHSFLYFGVNGAWSRLNARLYMRGNYSETINPCLPSGAAVDFESWIHYDNQERPLPRSDPRSLPYNVTMSNDRADFDHCTLLTRSLLRKEANKDWVEFSHDGDCSFAGVYQPPLPKKNTIDDEFIITSNYYDVWSFLQLPTRAKVIDIQNGARRICNMDVPSLIEYNSMLETPIAKSDDLYQFCFRATLTFEMLHTGYGFPLNYEIESADVVNGQKLGWALGSTLYEINTLPWEFGGEYKMIKSTDKQTHRTSSTMTILGMQDPEEMPFGSTTTVGAIALLLLGVVGLMLGAVWLVRRRPNRRQFYQAIPSANYNSIG